METKVYYVPVYKYLTTKAQIKAMEKQVEKDGLQVDSYKDNGLVDWLDNTKVYRRFDVEVING